MIYELSFNKSAMNKWGKLAPPIRAQFKAKLAERLENPHVPASRLSTRPNCYKIKLRSLGYDGLSSGRRNRHHRCYFGR